MRIDILIMSSPVRQVICACLCHSALPHSDQPSLQPIFDSSTRGAPHENPKFDVPCTSVPIPR